MSSEEDWIVPREIPLPLDFVGFDPRSERPDPRFHSYERHLPHWRVEGACYLILFRLNDSLPEAVVEEMRQEAEQWQVRLKRAATAGDGHLPPEEAAAWQEFQRVQLLKLETVLDEGHGECWLRQPPCRNVVATALHHFEGSRCELLSYAIMPNHVHVLLRPLGTQTLEELVGSWKWFTADRLNRDLRREGAVWQQETFDRIIRDGEHYAQAVRYIAKNPLKARLLKTEATVWFCEAIREANEWGGGGLG